MRALLVTTPRITGQELNYLGSMFDIVTNPDEADIVVAAGGDNTMLEAIHLHYGLKIPFFGWNFGRVGFLLNKIAPDDSGQFMGIIANAKPIDLWAVQAKITYEDGIKATVAGFNDIWISPIGGQTVRMNMSINDRDIGGTIVGDGLIVSTPQGSTGYNRSAGGKIIKPSLPALQITPKSCTIGERRIVMNSIIENADAVVKIEFEDFRFRPADVFHDGKIVSPYGKPTIESIEFRRSPLEVKLLFDSESGFYDKIYNLQYYED